MKNIGYPVKLIRQKTEGFLVKFIDLPEAITQGENLQNALEQAKDCLAEAISNRIKMKLDIPVPSMHKENQNIISLPIVLAAKTALYLAMRESNLSNVALAKKLNCNEKEVRRLLDPYYKSKISFLEEVLHMLGKRLNVSIIDSSESHLFPSLNIAKTVINTVDSLYDEKSEDAKNIFLETKDFIKNSINIIYKKSFPNKIKLYKNYCHYSVHLKEEKVKNRVNTLFHKYIDFLDISKEEFIMKFKGNYGESLFELVMAEFIYKNFKLKKRTEAEKNTKNGYLTDLEFQENGKIYLLDCTTRTSTLVQDYINILPKFNDYFPIAKILFQTYGDYKIKYKRRSESQWYHTPEVWPNILNSLNDSYKYFFWKKLRLSETISNKITSENLNEFNKWLFLNRYMLSHFSKILPEEIVKKFSTLNLTPTTAISITTNERSSFNEALSKFLAQSIVDKLNKGYFTKEIPVILSISLALLDDFKMIRSPEELFQGIIPFLVKSINEVVQIKINECESLEQSETLKEKFKNSLKNLYAVIIDTTYLNWLLDIDTKMPEGYNNYYGIIYNTEISETIKKISNKELFNAKIPYQRYLPLDII